MLPRRIALQPFELGEDLFDRIEIRTIGRQKDHSGTDRTNGPASSIALVAAEIVEHDDIASLKCRNQELLDIGLETASVDRSVEYAACRDPVVTQSGEKGQCLPVNVGDLGPQSLTFATAAVRARHVGLQGRYPPVWAVPWVRGTIACSSPRSHACK